MSSVTSDTAVLGRLVALRDRDAVDVGCGGGGLTRWLDREGARAIGIEVSEAKVRAATQGSDGSGARFALGRGEALGLGDASQDVVVYLRSLHHVPVSALGPALSEAHRVLRPGGRLVVVEPLPEGDFFALVSLVDDETAVRAAARAALDGAGDHGFTATVSEEYALEGVFDGLDAVRDQIVGVDPARAPVFDARRAQLQARFDRGGAPVPDGPGATRRRFTMPQRVDVLRRD